jgi:hypothetical protein
MLRNFYSFLNEYKNIGSLYHIIDIEKIFYILKHNKISSKYFSNISTTRDKMMGEYLGDSSTSVFKLELDGGALSNKYKMRPFSYKTDILSRLKAGRFSPQAQTASFA